MLGFHPGQCGEGALRTAPASELAFSFTVSANAGVHQINVISTNASIRVTIGARAIITDRQVQVRAQINSAKLHVSAVNIVSCVHDWLSVYVRICEQCTRCES